MKITFGFIAALVFAHQLLLTTTTTIPLACASPIPPSQAEQIAAAIAAAEAAQRAAEAATQRAAEAAAQRAAEAAAAQRAAEAAAAQRAAEAAAAQRAAEAAQRATPGAGTATPGPVKEPASQLPDTGGATNKMKMRKRAGLSGEDYMSSHYLSMRSLEDTTGNNTPSVKSVSSPFSSGRSPLLERRRGRLYERRSELKEEVVSPNSPETE